MELPFIADAQLFLAVLAATVAVTLVLWLAAVRHDRRRRRIPLRIHVAGSRGKTTTARLIGAGLRAGGRRVLVKTTGTDPTLILPDGSEREWSRRGPPSISEQVRFFREAARAGADAVVLESMAIEPEYLWASERYLVRATHTVITNVRPDHVEVVGSHPLAAARAMSLVLPEHAEVFLSAEAAVAPILERARRNGCKVTTLAPTGPRHEAANRAMALAVCAAAGLDRATAEGGLAAAGADRGALFMARGEAGGRPFVFANAFSCNDPLSLEALWRENPAAALPVVLLNLRDDRPERTRAFLGLLARLVPARRVFVTGFVPARWVRAAGFDAPTLRRLPAGNARRALAALAAAAEGAPIWGVGNYSRLGRDIVALLRAEAVAC
ncbi:MAG: poly-gamma-glutamate synthase PgsB [Rhodobacteraceae bacterium]|nr:poly-gamma-glutamate synthase PgsB [Paracoccaceae bacterium]